MAFAQVRARAQNAIFAHLGEDALWSGVSSPVRVRHIQEDEVAGFGSGSQIIVSALSIRVRQSEVPQPLPGHTVTMLDPVTLLPDGRQFAVISDPMLDRNAVWMCRVEQTVVAP